MPPGRRSGGPGRKRTSFCLPGLLAGLDVPLVPDQRVAVEENHQSRLAQHVHAVALHIGVVPARLVEGVLQQGCAQDEADLAPAHAGLELLHHFLGDDIALFHIDLVDAGEAHKAAGTEADGC